MPKVRVHSHALSVLHWLLISPPSFFGLPSTAIHRLSHMGICLVGDGQLHGQHSHRVSFTQQGHPQHLEGCEQHPRPWVRDPSQGATIHNLLASLPHPSAAVCMLREDQQGTLTLQQFSKLLV